MIDGKIPVGTSAFAAPTAASSEPVCLSKVIGYTMRRFWIRFDVKFGQQTYGVLLGCGITAESREDAIRMAKKAVFRGDPVPRVLSVVEDVDLSTLDANHVVPNIGDPTRPGVWYPAMNTH